MLSGHRTSLFNFSHQDHHLTMIEPGPLLCGSDSTLLFLKTRSIRSRGTALARDAKRVLPTVQQILPGQIRLWDSCRDLEAKEIRVLQQDRIRIPWRCHPCIVRSSVAVATPDRRHRNSMNEHIWLQIRNDHPVG